MTTGAKTGPEPTVADEKLTAWLRSRTGDDQAALWGIGAGTRANGLSNMTYSAWMRLDRAEREVIIRQAPIDMATCLFPTYDLGKQYEVMRALEATTDVPVPHCLFHESDPSVLGSSFYLMDRVRGDSPGDYPPHTVEGFIANATPQQREQLWWSSIEAIAKVGRVDPQRLGLPAVERQGNGSPIEREIDYFEGLYRWGRGDDVPRFDEYERVLAWLRAHVPPVQQSRLHWGDARFANMLYRDFEVVAVLDWELVSVADPVCDLAYFLVHQRITEDHPIPEHSRPRLEGFPSDEETIERFARMTGAAVEHVDYYWVFNAFKNLSMIQRFYSLAVLQGLMTPEARDRAFQDGGSLLRMALEVVDGP